MYNIGDDLPTLRLGGFDIPVRVDLPPGVVRVLNGMVFTVEVTAPALGEEKAYESLANPTPDYAHKGSPVSPIGEPPPDDVPVYETYDIIDKGELPHEPTKAVLAADHERALAAEHAVRVEAEQKVTFLNTAVRDVAKMVEKVERERDELRKRVAEFIRNGVEFGYIIKPEHPDPARDLIDEFIKETP